MAAGGLETDSMESDHSATVLLVGDDTNDRRSRLERAGVEVRHAATVAAATDALEEGGVHCVVTSASLGTDAVGAFVEHLGTRYPDLPVVVLTPGGGADDGETVERAVEAAKASALGASRTRDGWSTREAQYRTLVENLPGGGVALFDRDLRYTRVGGEVFEWFDRSADELEGRLMEEVHTDAYLDAHRPRFEAALDGERSRFEFEYDDHVYEADVVPVQNDDGAVAGGMVLTRDVTKRVERERALEESEKRFRALFEGTLDALMLADDEGRYIDANPAACELYGLPRAELIGKTAADFSPSGFDLKAAWESFLDTGSQRGEFELVTAEGERRVVAFAATTDIRPGEHLSALRDVTERVERERTLAEQNDRLDRFTSIVSHDLRSPLSVAKGRLELFRNTGDESHLDHVEDAIDRTGRLVEDLLAVARGGREVRETETVSVAEVAREAWQTIDTGESTLIVEAERPVEADPSRLRQLFENLFRNAVEHGSTSPPSQAQEDAVEHGSTSPPSQAQEDAVGRGEPNVEVRVLDTDAGFAVEDTGPGIPPAERERVFETGYTTAEEGTGIGLGIVEGVVTAHGWTVRVTEGTDGGARFEITTDGVASSAETGDSDTDES